MKKKLLALLLGLTLCLYLAACGLPTQTHHVEQLPGRLRQRCR